MRYITMSGSQSHHCCFEATVVDTHSPVMIGGKHYCPDGEPRYKAVCECFDETSAIIVADALNRCAGGGK